MAKIIINRAKKIWLDRACEYDVLLDEKEITSISNGSTAEFSVTSGKHSLQMKANWCTSAKIDMDVSDGDTLTFACAPNSSLILGMLYVTVWKNRYIKLSNPA